MKDTDLYAIGGLSSSSPAIFERRRRILSEARRLIGEGSPEGFSVRELCKKADVAPNTLYNAFGSKENVIALAITQYFEEFHEIISFQHDPITFDGMIERELATSMRNLEIPHFVEAITNLYFSSTDPAVRSALDHVGERNFRIWLEQIRMRKQIEKDVPLERIVRDLSHLLYATVKEWRRGELSDTAFINARFNAILSYLSGVAKGNARQELRELLADLHGPRTHIKRLTERARQQVRRERPQSI